jgi:hypothetical protein
LVSVASTLILIMRSKGIRDNFLGKYCKWIYVNTLMRITITGHIPSHSVIDHRQLFFENNSYQSFFTPFIVIIL